MIRYTRHARQRMIERKIAAEQVLATIQLPDEIVIGDEGESIAIRNFGHHEIRIVYRELDADTDLVITVIKTARTASD